MHRTFAHLLAVILAVFSLPRAARADEALVRVREPHSRLCCAFADHLAVHVGAAHTPVLLDIVTSRALLGHHSYAGWSRRDEGDGLVYTRRAGFVDVGHARDYADLAAYLTVRLRPLLLEGSGAVTLPPSGGARRVVVERRVPPSDVGAVSAEVARRAAFELSVWAEIVQYYGRGKMPGTTELYSAFTPEDLYSNLLGTALGVAALQSPRPYDDAMDAELDAFLSDAGAGTRADGRRVMHELEGKWWSARVPWPSADLVLARSFDIGPRLEPVLPPMVVSRPASRDPRIAPIALDVPESDEAGSPLADLYRIEIEPTRADLPRYPRDETEAIVTGADLPRLVAGVRAAMDADRAPAALEPDWLATAALRHYLDGIRLLDLGAVGGAAAEPARSMDGSGGGSISLVVGDTRGGDFRVAHLDVLHSGERGLIGAFSLFRSDSLYFCRDRETGGYRAPFLAIFGRCRGGEWLGVGGKLGEAFHDGDTGRTGLRPIALYGVLNALGNGQLPSYERVRILLRAGGDVEHVWTEAEGGVTIPRAEGQVLLVARSSDGRLEARGTTQVRVDVASPQDAGFESTTGLRWNFLAGGQGRGAPTEEIDPWGVASVGVVVDYAYWSRPAHAFPDSDAPFVSAQATGTWQLLLTGTLGFEGVAF